MEQMNLKDLGYLVNLMDLEDLEDLVDLGYLLVGNTPNQNLLLVQKP